MHLILFLRTIVLLFVAIYSMTTYADDTMQIPVLVYHNFNPTVPGSMSLTPARLEEQLKWIKDNGFTVVPLKDVVNYLQGQKVTLPAKPVVISADDGWSSVYTYMLPLIRKYNIPVTLFIYPETISHGAHAMTWEQLKELQKTGLFDIQGHTYSHPNFKQEKKHRSPSAYEKLVYNELFNSKKILEEKLGIKVTLLAWPFGIYNDYLEQQAAKAGYVMAFTIDAHHTDKADRPMAQARYMIVAGQNMKTFAAIMNGKAQGKKHEKVAKKIS